MVKIKNMIIYFNNFIELRLKRKYHRSCIFKYIIEGNFQKVVRIKQIYNIRDTTIKNILGSN